MTHVLIWRNEARQALSRLREADPAGARAVLDAVRALAVEPCPATSRPLGGAGVRRLLLGDVRVTYAVDEDHLAVHVYLVGQVPPRRRR